MSRYADWYAVELDGYLRGRMSEVQRFEATKEITNHFAEHVEDLVSKGMDPLEAEKAAIVAFGSPRQAAINLLGSSNGGVFGKWLVLVGCLMIALLTFSMGLVGILAKIQVYFPAPLWDYFYRYQHKAWTLLALTLVAGTVLTRRVPVVKMLAAGGLGIVMIGVFFYVGPELNYGNMPKDKLLAVESKWDSAHDATVRLAQLEKSIEQATYPKHDQFGKSLPLDKELALKCIKEDAPKMLAISSEYVKVAGTLTAGYLGPPTIDPEKRWSGGQDDGIEMRTYAEETGNAFPVSRRTFRYYETPQAALKAWTDSQKQYGGTYSVSGSAASAQESFIQDAKIYAGLSGPQLLIATILPVILIVLGFLIPMMIIGWPLSKIANMTLRTSFSRRFA